jgi:hypothetical protein
MIHSHDIHEAIGLFGGRIRLDHPSRAVFAGIEILCMS